MTDLMARPVVPVAGEEDAAATYERLAPYIDAAAELLVVNVIEKAGGGIDKASVEQREAVAEEAFETFRRLAAADGVAVETRILYDTDVVDAINDAAADADATSITFTSRGGSRIAEFLSGDVRSRLTSENDVPVVVLPNS